MACPRCGSNCTCACAGDPFPTSDWRHEVAMQVRAHKARKRRRDEPDSPQLEFADQESSLPENSTIALRTSRWRSEATIADESTSFSPVMAGASVDVLPAIEETNVASAAPKRRESADTPPVERPPLPPFPRITMPMPKVIEFPRPQARSYELAEPVGDQLRIFEAEEELPPPPVTHLSGIEIAPEEPIHATASDLEVPIQTAPLGQRTYAAAVDVVIVIAASGLFALCASLFSSSLPMNKPLIGGAVASIFLLVTIYYFLSLCFGHGTPGMEASGLCVLTFSGISPSRTRMGWRALATVLSAAALGMGFVWSLVDEDQLCWHDRITHTYLSSK